MGKETIYFWQLATCLYDLTLLMRRANIVASWFSATDQATIVGQVEITVCIAFMSVFRTFASVNGLLFTNQGHYPLLLANIVVLYFLHYPLLLTNIMVLYFYWFSSKMSSSAELSDRGEAPQRPVWFFNSSADRILQISVKTRWRAASHV